MNYKFFYLLISLVLLCSCNSQKAQSEVNNFCQMAIEIEENHKDLNLDDKQKKFVSKLKNIEENEFSSSTKNFLMGLSANAGPIEYQYFKEYAIEIGLENFDCPSLKNLFPNE